MSVLLYFLQKKRYVVNLIQLSFIFILFSVYAQDGERLHNNTWQSHYNSSSVNNEEVLVNWRPFYAQVYSGISQLKEDIIKNPANYPLQELENKDKSEPDNFRRWEYQMRRMPVKIAKPMQNLLKVTFNTSSSVTFCTDDTMKLVLTIENISDTDLPSFYFNISEIPGVTIYKFIKPKNILYVKRANTFTFSHGLKRNQKITVVLLGKIGCDGNGGSPVLKGENMIEFKLNWKLHLMC